MAAITNNIHAGKGANPNSTDSGVYGIIKVTTTTKNVAINKYFPGTLLKSGFLDLITKTIKAAEHTDSTNQPVLNCTADE